MTSRADARARQLAAPLVTYVPFALLLAALAPLLWPQDGVGDTFRFWYAGHIVASGGSPYDQSLWAAAGAYGGLATDVSSTCAPTPYEPACLWAYPPITALVFLPFGLLDVRIGLNLLAAFLFFLGVGGVVAVGQWMRALSPWTRALALCACIVSHAFVFDVHAGHFEGFGLIGIVAVTSGIATRRTGPVALGAVLLSLKPHLYLGIAAAAFIMLLARRDWRTLGWTAAAVAATNGIALIRYPEAVSAVLGRTENVIGLGWATAWSFGANVLPELPVMGIVIVYSIAALGYAAVLRFAPADRRTDATLVASGALGLTISPYVQPYDLLLLFPAFALSMTLVERGVRSGRTTFLLIIAAILAAGGWIAVVHDLRSANPALPGILPVVALIVFGAAAWNARVGRGVTTGAS
ncbi:MAG: DUF2029 domain-containing protein [Chloroflexota bacterium]|nr:DUF2029 domain-containing protein [Chloroflexota bacterium]